MSYYVRLIAACILSFALTLVIGKLLVKFNRKKHVGQNILHYVDKHSEKAGTPTMGGIMFLLPVAIIVPIFSPTISGMGIVALAVTLSYGVLGFLDDFLKIRHKDNLGLKAYQKIIGQLGIAVIVTVYCYRSDFIGTAVEIPFTDYEFNLKWWYIPFCLVAYIATTNAVNLTDGLDGLAGSVTAVYVGAFSLILAKTLYDASHMGDVLYLTEMLSLSYFSTALLGGLLGFLVFNSSPASIFMGDTGSLALGGAVTTLAVFTKNPLIILVLGIIYTLTCISVVIQVIYFKLTKKRVFIMAPFHHHLEYKGFKESKIVACYTIVAIIFALITLLNI